MQKYSCFFYCVVFKDKTRSVVGKETNKLIESYHFDQVFSSANGMNADFDILPLMSMSII